MQDMERRIDAWIDKIRDEYVQDVIDAVNIPSVSVKTKGAYPFGGACARMLDHMEERMKHYEFPFENHEYYCASSLINGSEGGGEIGIFGHLDVVPAGEGWSCDPFEGHVDKGYIVGRGSNDNKGSTFACIYAMRFLKEQGISLKNDVRLMYGCNEEDGMEDARYYLRNYRAPDVTIVPDSWWPVSCSEKGVYIFDINARLKNGNLLEFETIGADNTVPNRCTCILTEVDCSRVKSLAQAWDEIECTEEEGQKIRLTAYGIGTHASFPEGSKSAVKILTKYLLENELVTGAAKMVLEFVAESISDYEGRILNIDFRDEFAGNTTHVLTRARLEGDKLSLSYKICYPASENVSKAEVYRRLKQYFDRGFLDVVSEKASGPHFVNKDHPIVDILCKNASDVLGKKMVPFSQAGGTYAWWMPNAFAAGPGIPDRLQKLFHEKGHGGAHQPDECVEIDLLLKGIKIYILSLLEIDEWLSQNKEV